MSSVSIAKGSARVHAKALPRGISVPSARKREAVTRYHNGETPKEILVAMGVATSTLHDWVHQVREYDAWQRRNGR